MIFYKVVGPNRESSNFAMFFSEMHCKIRQCAELKDDSIWTAIHKLQSVQDSKEIMAFCKIYEKGTVVNKVPNTKGLLLFSAMYYAQQFKKESAIDGPILCVEGEEVYPVYPHIKYGCASNPEYIIKSFRTIHPPEGTVFCDSVRVLE